jgi:hypothetical protein
MSDTEQPMTHTAWAQHFRHRKFCKWIPVCDARADVDASGKLALHSFETCTVRGDSGHALYLPIGEVPFVPPHPVQFRKPMTHTAWEPYFRDGVFVEWVYAGKGRASADASGKVIMQAFDICTVRGDSGYKVFLPIGETPPDPPPDAQRPSQSRNEEE